MRFIKHSLNTTASLLGFFKALKMLLSHPAPPKPENGPSGRPFDRKLMILNVLLMHNE